MVQKYEQEPKRPRGRPRAYDADEALGRARDMFWKGGYSATTLDELSEATGMNRPSLYGAFGDKRALYLTTLERYVAANREAMDRELAAAVPLREALMRIYDLALSLYFRSDGPAQGCFLVGTAAVEAVSDAEVRDVLGKGLLAFDESFEARIRRAQDEGELNRSSDPKTLSKIASALLHTIALRSRAGDERSVLRATVEAGVAMLCAS